MQFNCPHCQYLLKVPDNAAGRTGTCPKCHNKVRVPSGETSEPNTVPCPFCAEMISPKAIKCRFCGEFLDSQNGGSRRNADDHESNHRPRHSTARHGAVPSSPTNGPANGLDNGTERESGHRARHRTARYGSIPSAPSSNVGSFFAEWFAAHNKLRRNLAIIVSVVLVIGGWMWYKERQEKERARGGKWEAAGQSSASRSNDLEDLLVGYGDWETPMELEDPEYQEDGYFAIAKLSSRGTSLGGDLVMFEDGRIFNRKTFKVKCPK